MQLVLLSFLSLCLCEIVNKKVVRNVDLTRPYVRETVTIDLVNNDDSTIANEYTFLVPKPQSQSVSQIAAFDALNNQLNVMPNDAVITLDDVEFSQYKVDLDHDVEGDNVFQVVFILNYIDSLTPVPKTGTQGSAQLMFFPTVKHYVSLYDTLNEVSKFKLLSPDSAIDALNLEPFPKPSKNGIFAFDGGEISKGHVTKFELHFSHPSSLTRIDKLNRTIWVSHWGGSVSFDESYDVVNAGTELSGGYSRALSGNVPNTLNYFGIKELEFTLPKNHREEYVVDLVGNVSTSRLRPSSLMVKPRYPIMGGWKYNFTLGWASDLSDFVRNPMGKVYILSVPLVYGPKNVGYRQVVNNVVLPEGAHNIEVNGLTSTAEILASDVYKTYSYLDIAGRPTVSVEVDNVIGDDTAYLVVTYNYSIWNALLKPLRYTFYTFLFLAAVKFSLQYLN